MPDTIPNQAYPTDADVALLDGQTDATTGLAYIAKGTSPSSNPPYEIQYNRRLLRQNQRLALVTEGLVVDEGGLAIGVYPCNYTIAGVRRHFTGATAQAIPDNATRRVYLDDAGDLQIAAAYPTDLSAHLPLASVTAANGKLSIAPETGYARLAAPHAVMQISGGIGAQAGEEIAVTLSLTDANGNAMAKQWLGEVWLSDTALGDLTATTPSGGITVSTGTQLGNDLTADKHLKAISDTAGQIVVTITHVSAQAYFLNINAAPLLFPTSFGVGFSAS